MEIPKIQVIGIDACRQTPLDPRLFTQCRLILLTQRFSGLIPESVLADTSIERYPITPLSASLQRIENALAEGGIVVLASGDPLFFGIGKTMIERFGREHVQIHPAISSIQHCFARFGLSWDQAAFVSLHGRNHANPVGLMLERPLTAILTDNVNRPEVLAAKLLMFFAGTNQQPTLYVAENIGTSQERLVQGDPQTIAAESFSGLCCLIVARKSPHSDTSAPYNLGLTEHEISHSRGLITKSEVRAAALHLLSLPRYGVLWDVGAGSGSVGLEAARLCPGSTVYSIEKNPDEQDNIRRNRERHSVHNLRLIEGGAPETLAGLPAPDRIFVGGSGGALSAIVECCTEALLPGGRIIISAVLEKTSAQAPQLLHEKGLSVHLHRLHVERTSYPLMEKNIFNPITLIVGEKTG